MTTHCINLTSHESLGFVNKRVSILWRPVNHQPVHAHLWYCIQGKACFTNNPHQGEKDHGPEIHAPYQPGDVLIGREAFSFDHYNLYPGYPIVYRADYATGTEPETEGGKTWSPEQKAWYPFRWRSAATMPSWAARHRHVIKSVSVKRCQDVTEAEASRSCERLEISPATIGGVAVHPMTSTYQAAFKAMIDARYPKAWDENLWMWRYEVEEAT